MPVVVFLSSSSPSFSRSVSSLPLSTFFSDSPSVKAHLATSPSIPSPLYMKRMRLILALTPMALIVTLSSTKWPYCLQGADALDGGQDGPEQHAPVFAQQPALT